MLGYKYITLDGVKIPNPSSLTENYENIEDTGISEAGTDLVAVTRLQKCSWSLTFDCSSFWLAKYKNITKKNTVPMIYKGETFTVRARITSAALVPNSEHSTQSDGYYTVTMEITEI